MDHADKFIQESQLNTRNFFELLEWVSYNRLSNLDSAQSMVRSTKNKIGNISNPYELGEQDYKDANNPKIKQSSKNNEKYDQHVIFKSLNDSSNISENFLNKVCSCQYQIFIMHFLIFICIFFKI